LGYTPFTEKYSVVQNFYTALRIAQIIWNETGEDERRYKWPKIGLYDGGGFRFGGIELSGSAITGLGKYIIFNKTD